MLKADFIAFFFGGEREAYMVKNYVKNNVKSQYHYFGDNLLVRNGMFDYMQLNPLQEMVVLLADGSHTKDEIYHTVLHNFKIEDTEKNRMLYQTMLSHLEEREIISFCEGRSESKVEISGKKGQRYPDRVMVEATNIFDSETHKRIRQKVLSLRETYKDEISIIKMGDVTSFMPKLGDAFHCQAGKTTIVITEEGEVVPCHMATRRFFQGYSFESYMQDVKNGITRDYTEHIRQFRQFMEDQGAKAQDLYCTGFCNVPD